jgi:hypothetical protein
MVSHSLAYYYCYILYTDLASRAIRPFFLEGGEPSNKPHVVEMYL